MTRPRSRHGCWKICAPPVATRIVSAPTAPTAPSPTRASHRIAPDAPVSRTGAYALPWADHRFCGPEPYRLATAPYSPHTWCRGTWTPVPESSCNSCRNPCQESNGAVAGFSGTEYERRRRRPSGARRRARSSRGSGAGRPWRCGSRGRAPCSVPVGSVDTNGVHGPSRLGTMRPALLLPLYLA